MSGADDRKVVSLRGDEIAQPGVPIPAVIEALERALERARSGEINGVFAVFVHSDECVSGGRYGVIGRSMIGMVEVMKLDLCREVG